MVQNTTLTPPIKRETPSIQGMSHMFLSSEMSPVSVYFWLNKKIQICYDNSLRRLLSIPKRGSASEMFVNLNIPAFGELMRKCVFGFCSAWIIVNLIKLLGLLLGHLLFMTLNVGSGGTMFCIDVHLYTNVALEKFCEPR